MRIHDPWPRALPVWSYAIRAVPRDLSGLEGWRRQMSRRHCVLPAPVALWQLHGDLNLIWGGQRRTGLWVLTWYDEERYGELGYRLDGRWRGSWTLRIRGLMRVLTPRVRPRTPREIAVVLNRGMWRPSSRIGEAIRREDDTWVLTKGDSDADL